MNTSVTLLVALAACSARPPPSQRPPALPGSESAAGKSESALAGASALAVAPCRGIRKAEVVLRAPSTLLSLHVGDASIYFSDGRNVVAVPLHALEQRTTLFEGGRNVTFSGAGDVLFVNDDEGAYLLHGATRRVVALGPPYARAAWRGERVYAARSLPAGGVAIDVITPGPPASKAELATIDARHVAGAGTPTEIAATTTDVYVALDELDARGPRPPSRVVRVPMQGGDVQHKTVPRGIDDLVTIGDDMFIDSLAHAYRWDGATDRAVDLDGIFWDGLSAAGDTAFYVVATLLPMGGIGGYLYRWTPPNEPEQVCDELRDPSLVTVGSDHVYFTAAQEVWRIPRAGLDTTEPE